MVRLLMRKSTFLRGDGPQKGGIFGHCWGRLNAPPAPFFGPLNPLFEGPLGCQKWPMFVKTIIPPLVTSGVALVFFDDGKSIIIKGF